MKIAAFCYSFEHEKSVQGLLHLKANGFDDVTVFAAPFKKLNLEKSKIRVTPVFKSLHPRDVARSFNYEYIVIDHDHKDIVEKIRCFDVGLILGARILKKHVTEALPIINAHPGILPWNRNADNLKWAIMHQLPQVVTTHLVDEHVDRGFQIEQKAIDVMEDDTLLDVFIRLRQLEYQMLISGLKEYKNIDKTRRLDRGHYNKVMDHQTEVHLDIMFENYKKNYSKIKSRWGF